MKIKTISRRSFAKSVGALIVSFRFLGPVSQILAQSGQLSDGDLDPTALDSWLAISKDGTVTIFTSKVELGTGVETALAQIAAEELDVPFHRVKMDAGDTAKTIDQEVTAASRTIERGGPQLRQAAAAARQQLLKLASVQLGAPAEKLMVSNGTVSAPGSIGKKITYGELVGDKRFDLRITATGTGWDMKVAPEVPHKDPKDYKIVGTSVARVDLPKKFTGEFTYAQDVRVPGMLHGRVVRPAVVNSRPEDVDESSISHISGIVKIVQVDSFLGVVANSEWSAIQAAKALKVTWSTPAIKLPANPDELYAYLKNTKSVQERSLAKNGDADAAISRASKTFEATYRFPFQLHGMIGPSCAVADVREDRVTIWAGSQGPFYTRKRVATLLRVPERSVRVFYREGSGSYGRLQSDDVTEDAALMSRAVGKPVRVQWSRQDEHGWEPKGPAQLMSVRAGVDAQGNVVAWDYMDRSFPWTEQGNPLLASRQVGLKPTVDGFPNGSGGGGEIYTFENQRVVSAVIPWVEAKAPSPLRTSNLRAPGDLARSFASETFMDEIASNVGVDPVQFRLRYLSGKDKRPIEALLAVTKKVQWSARSSPQPDSSGPKATGRGVAIANRASTMTASVAEVEVDKATGKVVVKRVTLAHDCGLIVNPDGLRNQIDGNIIQAVSRTLLEEVKFDANGINNLDWASYPILRYEEIPDIDIVLINRTDMPSLGAGEPSMVSVPAAIANAIFDAVGVRLRDIPLTPQRVLSAMQARSLK